MILDIRRNIQSHWHLVLCYYFSIRFALFDKDIRASLIYAIVFARWCQCARLGDACFCLSNESYEVYVTVAAISSEWWGDGERSPQRCPWAEPLVRGAAV